MASSVLITSRKLPRVVLRLSANSVFANNYGVSIENRVYIEISPLNYVTTHSTKRKSWKIISFRHNLVTQFRHFGIRLQQIYVTKIFVLFDFR